PRRRQLYIRDADEGKRRSGTRRATGATTMTTTIPETMNAVAITEPGGPLVLKQERRDVPQPGEGEILVRVRAAGVNRPDVAQRKGAYPAPPGASDLPG